MLTALLEIIGLLLKEGKQLTVNTGITLLVLLVACLGVYTAWVNSGHLDRIDHHLQHEDTDIILMKQTLDDHGIHVNQQDRYESPRQRERDEEDLNSNTT